MNIAEGAAALQLDVRVAFAVAEDRVGGGGHDHWNTGLSCRNSGGGVPSGPTARGERASFGQRCACRTTLPHDRLH